MVEWDLGEAQVAGAGTHGCSKLGRVPPAPGAWSLCPPVAGLAVSEARALAPRLGPWLQNLRTHEGGIGSSLSVGSCISRSWV